MTIIITVRIQYRVAFICQLKFSIECLHPRRLSTPTADHWVGHIGADRLVGYGLKFESGFKDTHLSTQPSPVAAFTESDN